MAWQALAGGALSAIGSAFGQKSARKDANLQYQYQLDLNQQAAYFQQQLAGYQNMEVRQLNSMIHGLNQEIMANHSTNERDRWEVSHQAGSIDLKRMVAEAEAAGFNPLTVLRGGGLAGYFTSTSTLTTKEREKVARNLMGYMPFGEIPQGPSAGSAPQIQSGNPIGDGINAAIQLYGQYGPEAAARQKLERDIGMAQIANLNQDTAATARRMMFQAPSWTGSGLVTGGGELGGSLFRNVRQQVLSPGGGAPTPPIVGDVTYTNPHRDTHIDPTVRDTAAYEDRYGDILGSAFGGYVAIKDAMYELNRQTGGAGHAAGNWLKDTLGGIGAAVRTPPPVVDNRTTWQKAMGAISDHWEYGKKNLANGRATSLPKPSIVTFGGW